MSPSDIINEMQELVIDDGGGNYVTLYEGLGIAGEVISKILGILIILELIIFPIVISLEVMYINIPMFQDSLTKAMNKNKTANNVLGIFLRDAINAIKDADTVRTGESPNKIYLIRKSKLIFLVFLINGIILGPVTMIINWIVRIVSGIVLGQTM